MINKLNVDNFFKEYKVNAKFHDYQDFDNHFCLDIKLFPPTKISNINKIIVDLCFNLKISAQPILKIDNLNSLIRLEFIKSNRKLIEFKNEQKSQSLDCFIGKDIENNNIFLDIKNAPHVLIAGSSGSGKSTLLHTIIANLIDQKNTLLYLIDPKNIEFSKYSDYYNSFIATDYKSSVFLLQDLVDIMNIRYSLGTEQQNLNNIVVFIDEFADLIAQDVNNKLSKLVQLLAQKSRAAKIHLILSTQRPSREILTGAIKTNFSTRISCRVGSTYDSKIIIEHTGAEKLSGRGDAYILQNSELKRFQVAACV